MRGGQTHLLPVSQSSAREWAFVLASLRGALLSRARVFSVLSGRKRACGTCPSLYHELPGRVILSLCLRRVPTGWYNWSSVRVSFGEILYCGEVGRFWLFMDV